MEIVGRELGLPQQYNNCMILLFNDIVNKDDDPTVVPQEDLLNHKPPVPAKLEITPSTEHTLEALKQDWYDLPASPSDGAPCAQELDLKRLAMKGAGIDHQQPNPFLHNISSKYQAVWTNANSTFRVLNL
ncbi:hypothetical protein R1flu_009761 [Riccia fluitans]|uniref:Uncharacterized protein n=1 Tax=Riccia fluitans TaxID=41844 RepID=A0ABD1Z447_9MARC